MEILAKTNIDFMKYRRIWVAVSIALILLSIFSIFFGRSLNLGIDFAGGTQLTVKFNDEPEVEELRTLFLGAGIDAQIQRFGDAGDNEVLIKTTLEEGSEEGRRTQLVAVLDESFNPGSGGAFDLNQRGTEALTEFLVAQDPDGVGEDMAAREARYAPAAAGVAELRREDGLIESWDELSALDALSPASLETLERNATLGAFAVLGADNVGPQIGAELRRKGVLAVVMSLIGMLAYIWYRFELRFGVGALIAVMHDIFITLGLFAFAGFEFNLTTVAAFLTLVGYSVNDSVVVFDRVRENLRRTRVQPLVEVMNRSLNQTLSRTVLTSGTTLMAVGSLLFLGGDVLRGFAFIMTIGVIAGTYSSIYIASPFTLLWEERFSRAARTRSASAAGAGA